MASSSYGETILVWWSNTRNLCARISVTGREGVSECLVGLAFEGEGGSMAQSGRKALQMPVVVVVVVVVEEQLPETQGTTDIDGDLRK